MDEPIAVRGRVLLADGGWQAVPCGGGEVSLAESEAAGALGEYDIENTLESPWSDFEDACLYQCAKRLRVEAIITRNQADFERSTIPVYDCAEFFARLKDAHGLVYEEIDW